MRRRFLEGQGYTVSDNVLYQDNQSAMLLGTNGRGSSSKRARHMNIRYFFVADCQKRNEIIITYCPTDEMIGDFFTKPLGGAKFRRFRNIIMNCDVDDYGPVDVDELMTAHYKRVDATIEQKKSGVKIDGHTEGPWLEVRSRRKTDKDINDPTIERSSASKVGSQECVGRKNNGECAKYRIAHKNKKNSGNSPLIPRSHKLAAPRTTSKEVSWAEVVATSE